MDISVQVAVDATTLDRARELAGMAVEAGADWIEAGTPLLVFAGIDSISVLKQIAGDRPVVADFKAQDGVEKYYVEAGRRGAGIASVLGVMPDASIEAAVRGGRKAGVAVMVDLLGLRGDAMIRRAQRLREIGADLFLIHLGHDEAHADPGRSVLEGLDDLVAAVDLPVGVSTFTREEAVEAVHRGARFIVQGEPILSMPDAARELGRFIESVKKAGTV